MPGRSKYLGVRDFFAKVPRTWRSRSTSPAPPPHPPVHPRPSAGVQAQPSRSRSNSQSLSPAPPTPSASTSVTSRPPVVSVASPSSQASTPPPPPSLPLVLAVPQPQLPLPPGQLQNLAFLDALKKHIDDLSPEEQLQFRAGSTGIAPEGLIAQTRKYDETHKHASHSRRCAPRVEGFLKAVDAYLKPLSIMIGHSPQFSSLVVGAVHFTVQLGLKFAAFFNKLVEMMEFLEGHLGYLAQYAVNFESCKKVQEALSSAYGDLLNFCTGARRVFLDKNGNESSWTSFRIFLRTTWEPFEENFNNLNSNFRNHVDIVIRTAAVAEHERLLSKEMLEAEEKEDELRHNLLAWLSDLDFDKDHERIYRRRHVGTGDWLVDSPEFKDWEGSKESSLLWCHGTPGVGKSVLASLVLETISAKYSLNSQIGVAFVYFNFQDRVAQNLTKVVSTIIKQLARQKKVLPKELKQFYKLYYREASFPTEGKLEAQLADLSAKFDQVFLVMDAMDEFEDRESFLPIISRFAQGSSSTHGSSSSIHSSSIHNSPRNDSTIFKIFVTSRREKDIERTFTSCNFPTIEIEVKKVDADIETFIQYQLKERSGDVIMDQNLKDKIAQALISKSSGMFLWVRYQLDYIYEQPSIEDIDEILDSLPPDMNATYTRILERIDKQVPARREIAQRALMWVLNAGRPLKLKELALAVSIKPNSTSHKDLKDYEHIILDTCGNLLVENDGIVRPVHYTVQEFLTGPARSLPRQYHINIHCHSELAQLCLQYLLFEEISLCDTIAWGGYYDEGYPFGLYAAGYWDYHVQRTPDPTLPHDLVRNIDKFLDSKGNSLRTAFHMRYRKKEVRLYRGINPLDYCLALNLLHLYQLSHRLDTSIVSEEEYRYALHHAASSGSSSSIKLLIGMGFPVDAQGSDKRTPLHEAVLSGHAAAAEPLLDSGADVNAMDWHTRSALYFAARGGDEVLVQMLLDSGADVNLTGGDCGTALGAAAQGGHQLIVQMLLDSGADVNLTGGDCGTALGAAAQGGHQLIVQMLMDSGADVNLTGGDYSTALGSAAYGGVQAIVQLLLDSGADVNLTGGVYGTALGAAAKEGHQVIVQLLLDSGADVNLTGGYYGTALGAAASQGRQIIVQMLLDSGADVNLTGGYYGTALGAAASQGRQIIVQMLLDSGADVNLTGGKYGTALCAAAKEGHQAIVQMLLENRADVNLTDGRNCTALCAATSRQHMVIVQKLLDRGADIKLTAGEGAPPCPWPSTHQN